jgi:hypothetical protein
MATKRRISRPERAEELRLLHEAGDDAWWGRPDTDTVNAVWALVAPTLPDELQRLAGDFTTKQALTVALIRCVQVGENPGRWKTARQRQKRHTVSRNDLFDALAPKWSRTFKTVAEDGRPGLVPTPWVYAQARGDAETARRQLLAVGIRLADIWRIIAGDWSKSPKAKRPGANPLFFLTRPTAKLGYRVNLRDTDALAKFRRLCPTARGGGKRLLLDADPWPARVDRYRICAERPYDMVEEDAVVLSVLETLERTRLTFNVWAFKADYDSWERLVDRITRWKRRVPYERRAPFARRVRIAQRLQIRLDAHRQVRRQVETLPDTVLIKSQFFRDQEGRFHAKHFWPSSVSGGHDFTVFGVRYSQRGAWFSDRRGTALVGCDVSSSQTQVLAVLLALEDLEALTREPGFKIKDYLAQEAMARLPLRRGATPATMRSVMKDAWTRILYGGHAKEIVWDHFDALVPGTFTKARYLEAVRKAKQGNQRAAARARSYNAAIRGAERNLEGFLESIPWYGKPGEEKLSDFLRACQQIAVTARGRDTYAGVSFTDPLTGTTIRWNPPRRGRVRLNCQGFQVVMKLPGGWAGKKGTSKRRFIDAVPHHETGDYPASAQKLTQAVAPGIVHFLDAMFNALVVTGLEKLGIADCVAIHDSWLLAADTPQALPGAPALPVALGAASRGWMEKLGVVYVELAAHLRGTGYEPWIARLGAQWAKRVHEKRWPEFRVAPVSGTRRIANVSKGAEEPSEGPAPSAVSTTKSAI